MSANLCYADVFRPSTKVWASVYDILLVIAGSIAIGLSAQVYIGWPVPITGQTFAVLLIAALYGANRGAATVLVYIAEGLFGLPVFTKGQFGIATIIGPTGGYLFGFVLAAYVVGLLSEKGFDRTYAKTFLAMILGNCIILAFGVVWLFLLASAGKFSTDYNRILQVGLYIFIPGDIIKSLFAAALLPTGWKLLKSMKIK
jgi:biotin transport system substrate-specific component